MLRNQWDVHKMAKKRKIGITILLAIIIGGLLVLLGNLTSDYIFKQPDYNSDCYKPMPVDREMTQAEKDQQQQCFSQYDEIYKKYNQKRFYFFASLGGVLLIYGITRNSKKDLLLQISSLGSGGILLGQGAMNNLQNKLVVIVVLVVLVGASLYIAKKNRLW